MSGVQDQPEDWQRVWQGSGEPPAKEDRPMILRLAQEKQRSLFDLLREQNMTAYILTLAFAPLTGIAAWRARQMVFQLGYLIMTATLVAGALVVWLNARKARAAAGIDLNTLQHHQRLLRFYDSRIRFSRSIKYWYAIPLFSGAGLVLYPAGEHFLGRPWGIAVTVGFLLLSWIGVWHMHDVRGAADLRRRKDEVRQLLDEMGKP